MLFAYFGPETVMPLTSTIAAVIGLVLMFGKHTFRFAWMMVKRIFGVFGLGRSGLKGPSAKPMSVRQRREKGNAPHVRIDARQSDQVGS